MTALFNVQIVTLATLNVTSLGAIPLIGPAIDKATEELRMQYEGVFSLNHTFLHGEATVTCDDLSAQAEDLVADFYYRLKKRDPASFMVIITPGCGEQVAISALTFGMDVPIIFGSSTLSSFRDRRRYPHVIASGYANVAPYMRMTITFLRLYKWNNIFVVYDSSGVSVFKRTAFSMRDTLKQFIVNSQVYMSDISCSDNSTFQPALQHFRNVARVLMFFGHADCLRSFLIFAYREDMTDGNFVYCFPEPLRNSTQYGTLSWQKLDLFDEVARASFQSVMITSPLIDNQTTIAGTLFEEDLIQRSFKKHHFRYRQERPSVVAKAMYECLLMFGIALNETLTASAENGFHLFSSDGAGRQIVKRFLNRTFLLPTGPLYIDNNGERAEELVLKNFDYRAGIYEPVILQDKTTFALKTLAEIQWKTKWPIPNKPFCGYSGAEGPCLSIYSNTGIIAAVCGMSCVFFLSICAVIGRMVLLETRLRDRSWDMELGRMNFAYEATSVPLESVTAVRITVIPQMRPWSENKRIAFYDGTKILLQKQLTVTQFMENRKSVSLLTKTRALSHVNCVSFIGVLKWKEAVWFANEHCSRGNLRNLIVNGNLSFDAGLREHIISDIIEGIFWIHSSGLKYHGKLQSKICLIDHHFTAKVAETAYDRLLSSMSSQSVNRTPSGFESFICTAPELRNAGRTATGTPAADIYSAGMIFFEIISESLIKSAKPEDLDLDSPSLSCPLILKNLVQMCWSSEPRNRPTAAECRDQYSKLIGKYSGTFVERLLSRMDAYAMTLEIAVAERTHELMEERRNCDKILLEMLPESIVELLRHGETVYPEIFEFATVSFSDLAGFPEFVTRANPLAVVTFLNESHSLLDQVASQFDVYKVETVNDSYLVVSGVPLKNGWRHGEEICRMALIVRKKFNEAFSHGQMRVRTGIHSGPCVTAVIGLKRPRYCLFGDTVNTASRMETQGKANKIQMSAVTASLVRKMQGLLVIARGSIAIKGKGDMETFWLEYIIGANLEKREGTQREHN